MLPAPVQPRYFNVKLLFQLLKSFIQQVIADMLLTQGKIRLACQRQHSLGAPRLC